MRKLALAAVLCAGDSFTFGTGASSPAASYPQQLQAQLRARGHDVAVSNGGYPPKDSAYVLRGPVRACCA